MRGTPLFLLTSGPRSSSQHNKTRPAPLTGELGVGAFLPCAGLSQSCTGCSFPLGSYSCNSVLPDFVAFRDVEELCRDITQNLKIRRPLCFED